MQLEHHGPPAGIGLDIVVSSVASDSHTWNLVFLQSVLEELGHRVTNLGPCVPEELLVRECLRAAPDLVVISSVNGHGHRDGLRLIERVRSRSELAHVPVVIGGKLGVTGALGAAERGAALVEAGFDAVFGDDMAHVAGRGVSTDVDAMAAFRSFVGALPVAARSC